MTKNASRRWIGMQTPPKQSYNHGYKLYQYFQQSGKICWKRYSPRTRTMLYIAVQDFLSARDFPINASASTIQFYRVLRDGHSPYTIFLCFLRRNCCGQYKMERSSNALERRTSTDRDRMRMAMTMVMTSAGHRAIARW